jgi:cytochrome P450
MVSGPYRGYRAIRSRSPVCWDEGTNAWLITAHRPAEEALRSRLLSSDPRKGPTKADHHTPSMLSSDPPEHGRLRRLVSKNFSPRVLNQMYPQMVAIVADLLAKLDRRRMDFVLDFALPLPLAVIAEVLGIPHDDRNRLLLPAGPDSLNPGVTSEHVLTTYFAGLVPNESMGPGLLRDLRKLRNAGQTTEAELATMCTLLLIASYETTSCFLGSSLLTLLQNPDQLVQLRDTPAFMALAIEELVRYESPLQVVRRIATADVRIDGKLIRAGQTTLIVLGLANRDPTVFEDPETLRVNRSRNPHLGFGGGEHFCLGAALARLEAQVAFTSVLRSLPRSSLHIDPKWSESLAMRGLRGLDSLSIRPE